MSAVLLSEYHYKLAAVTTKATFLDVTECDPRLKRAIDQFMAETGLNASQISAFFFELLKLNAETVNNRYKDFEEIDSDIFKAYKPDPLTGFFDFFALVSSITYQIEFEYAEQTTFKQGLHSFIELLESLLLKYAGVKDVYSSGEYDTASKKYWWFDPEATKVEI